LIDLYPTLNELCDLPTIDSHDGVSLVPFLKNPGLRSDRVVVTEFRKGNAAVRSERYRYIRYAGGGEELYDHSSDPNEWENLISVADHRTIADRLARHLPETWAPSAPTKAAFDFDPDTFTWKEKRSGRVVNGRAKD
jgi:arylsulfatase A-like enzyme